MREPEKFRDGVVGRFDDLRYRLTYGRDARKKKADYVEHVKALVNQNCRSENPSYDPDVAWSEEEMQVIDELVIEARKICQTARPEYLHAQLHELRLISQHLQPRDPIYYR